LVRQGVFGEAVDRIGGEPIRSRMARRAPIRHLDPSLILITMILAAFGAVMIFSATANTLRDAGADPATYLTRQIIFIVIGAVILVALSAFDYRYLKAAAPFIYVVTLIGLVLVLTPMGEEIGGAKRWINLGFFQAQPSEYAKLAVIIAMSAWIVERRSNSTSDETGWLDTLVVCAIAAVPSVLIFLEPDLGTMMVMIALVAVTLLVAGAKLRHFGALVGVSLVAIIIAMQFGLIRDYQIDRITAFLDSTPDPQSEGYNLTQAKVAIAKGGLRGTGLASDKSLTSLDYVPEQHTDFIFTAVGEQLGFLGSATVLGLFGLLIWRALRIAALSRDLFGTLLASGIVALWVFQLFVNVGMTMGIMPITGIPLPFISYGGSHLLANFIAVALLHNIHMRRFM
jgi:rod shape determining protein RodA